jgi:serine/threonine protein kinase
MPEAARQQGPALFPSGVVCDRFRIDGVLGVGGTGTVFRALDLEREEVVALKAIPHDATLRQRARREASVAGKLRHPNVVRLRSVHEDGQYVYIASDIVEGVDLAGALRQGQLGDAALLRVAAAVCSGLAHAHEHGVVHRDVKPANVLLTPLGHAKLADFGLVRRHAEPGLTGAKVAGTPTFMAPELFDGSPASPRSDIYAVGVMFYYLLSARLPFSADRISRLIYMHRRKAVPDIRKLVPAVNDDLAEILARGLAKEPSARFASSEELIDALDSAIAQLRDTEGLLREAVEGLDCFIQGARDHFRILFKLPNDRLQEVYLEVGQNRHNERLLSVFSVCCAADPRHYEFALKLNAEMTYGGLSVRNVNAQDMFVMTRTFPRGHVHPDDVRAALVDIARRSDWVEQQLTHADVY